jgi:hypothetical protein
VIVLPDIEIRLITKLRKDELCLAFDQEKHFFNIIAFKKEEFTFIVPLGLHQRAYPRDEVYRSLSKELQVAVPLFIGIDGHLELQLTRK